MFLSTGQMLESWTETEVIFIHKKSDISKLIGYPPIIRSDGSIIYKNTHQPINVIDYQQPRKEAGFCSEYRTIYHLHTANNLIEKCNEYNLNLHIAFIDH